MMSDLHGRLVLVEWIDSVQPGARWIFRSQYSPPPPAICWSVGWVVAEDREVVVLASNVTGPAPDGDYQFTGDFDIPRCAIRRIVDLADRTSNSPTSRSRK